MQNVTVIQLDRTNWQELKEIRLEALLYDPDAFGSTYARSSQKTDEEWQMQLKDPHVNYFVARNGTHTIGMIGMAKSKEDQGVWELLSLYVNKTYRGQGIGKLLVEVVVKKAKDMTDARKVKLWVYKGRHETIDFYKACQFIITEAIGEDSTLPNMYHNTFVMERNL